MKKVKYLYFFHFFEIIATNFAEAPTQPQPATEATLQEGLQLFRDMLSTPEPLDEDQQKQIDKLEDLPTDIKIFEGAHSLPPYACCPLSLCLPHHLPFWFIFQFSKC